MSETSFDGHLRLMQNLCASREICISEAETKLKKRNVSEKDVEKIIALLLDAGYIDEKRYAEAFAHDKLLLDKWGPLKIKQALLAKRIPASIVSGAIAEKECETDTDETVSILLRRKFLTLKASNNREAYAKLVRFGMSRGFDFSTVSKHASQITGEKD
ncbi:MAG: RecX family transcriptional regulator [Prevotellaceae bacterium]|jgi:regulatory protein|nr:RecX family transcriptional regulator [Prevotellaceae bacterium]